MGERSHILELLIFAPCSFSQVAQLLGLLLDDLLILELEQFAFLFEVGDNLGERLFEQLDLGLEHLDFLLLFELAARVLLRGQTLVLQFQGVDLVFLFDLLDLLLKVSFLVFLQLCLILEPLVLCLDVAFDLRNVLFSLRLRLLLVIFQELCVELRNLRLLSLEVFFALALDVLQLAEEHLVSLFFVFKLPLFDQPLVLVLEQHFLFRNQGVHLLCLVLQLRVLLADDFLLLELSAVLVGLQLVDRFRLQLLQLLAIALDCVLLLVNLSLKHAGDFKHVIFVAGD